MALALANLSDCRVALLGASEGGHSYTSMMHELRSPVGMLAPHQESLEG
jgi:hypothetical protein